MYRTIVFLAGMALLFPLGTHAQQGNSPSQQKKEIKDAFNGVPPVEYPAIVSDLLAANTENREMITQWILEIVGSKRPGSVAPVVSTIINADPSLGPTAIDTASEFAPPGQLRFIQENRVRGKSADAISNARSGNGVVPAQNIPRGNRPEETPGNVNGNRPSVPPGHVRDPRPGRDPQGPRDYARP